MPTSLQEGFLSLCNIFYLFSFRQLAHFDMLESMIRNGDTILCISRIRSQVNRVPTSPGLINTVAAKPYSFISGYTIEYVSA